MSATANLHRASSVILLRPAQPQGFEFFLTRRPDEMPFLGGTYGFPGGSVHESDYGDGMLRRCRGLSGEGARKIIGAHLSPREALGYWIAAIRTLFEEVGVLLAITQNGKPVTSNAELNARFLEIRTARRDGALDFLALMESENLYCDAAGLAYFSHWHTPATPSSSIDTRFFLAAMPEPQTRLDMAGKITRGRWLTPDRALQLFNRGELPIAFSTFASLRTLADFDDVKRLLKEFQPAIT